MMINARTPAHDARRHQALTAWEYVLDEVLRSGFYGTAAVEVSVQDGALQLVRRRIEQIERPVAVAAQRGAATPAGAGVASASRDSASRETAPRTACRAVNTGNCRG